MRNSKLFMIGVAAVAIVFAVSIDSYGQGRGRGGGGNAGGSGGNGGGPPAGVGVDRGLGTASGRSDGRANDGWGTANNRSDGRRDMGIDRARQQELNRERALRVMPDDQELNRYRGISKKLGVSAEILRDRYVAAATLDPDLKFGQFVAANVVADNLNERYPNVTTAAILLGLQNGDSIGETLRDLRVDPAESKRAEKEAKQRIKEMMPRD